MDRWHLVLVIWWRFYLTFISAVFCISKVLDLAGMACRGQNWNFSCGWQGHMVTIKISPYTVSSTYLLNFDKNGLNTHCISWVHIIFELLALYIRNFYYLSISVSIIEWYCEFRLDSATSQRINQFFVVSGKITDFDFNIIQFKPQITSCINRIY